jgi:sugar phosphate permease
MITNSQTPLPVSHLPVRPDGPTHARFGTLGWLCLAATIAYICRNSIGTLESTIRKDLQIDEVTMGYIISSFFLTYAIFQIPTGMLGQRWGSRRCLPLFSVAWSVAAGLMSCAVGTVGVVVLFVSRLSNGVFQAGLFPCATNTVSKWFAPTGRALAMGGLGSFMSIGGAIGAALSGLLLEPLGWRLTMLVFSSFGLVWAIGFYLWFRDRPEDHAAVSEAELALIQAPDLQAPVADQLAAGNQETAVEAAENDEPIPWRALLFNSATWCICGQQVFRGAGYIFFASWFATYLQETRDVTPAESGLLNSLPLLAAVGGTWVGGAVSDALYRRTGSLSVARRQLATVSVLACAGFVLAAYFIADPLWAVIVISIGAFCASVAGPCAYTITIDMGGRHVATLFATMNMCGNFGALLFINAVPWSLKLIEHRYPEYAGSAWDAVLLLFGLMYVGAGLCWFFLRTNGTVLDHSWVSPKRGSQGSRD